MHLDFFHTVVSLPLRLVPIKPATQHDSNPIDQMPVDDDVGVFGFADGG